MSLATPILIGIAHLSCVVTLPGSPFSDQRIAVAIAGTGNGASIALVDADGNRRVVEPGAKVSYLPEGGLLVGTGLKETDFSKAPAKDLCFVAQNLWTLDLQETSFGSYEGTFHHSMHLDFNPNITEPCPAPFPLDIPPSPVRCVAAIR